MTPKIARFLAEHKQPTPCLVVDLDVMAGADTAPYSSVAFNGIPPLTGYYI